MVPPVRRFCPRCAAPAEKPMIPAHRFACDSCGFVLYQNTATAVGVFLLVKKEDDDHLVFARRNREPALGLLDIPGGFVDPGESAEEALNREVREETGLEIRSFRYLGSAANTYLYREVTYTTCDLYFSARISAEDFANMKAEPGEIASFELRLPDAVKEEELAFVSLKYILFKSGIEIR